MEEPEHVPGPEQVPEPEHIPGPEEEEEQPFCPEQYAAYHSFVTAREESG